MMTDLLGGQVLASHGRGHHGLAPGAGSASCAHWVWPGPSVPFAPELPLVRDLVSGFDVKPWHGLMAPAGTPPAIVNKLSEEVQAFLRTPAAQAKLQAAGDCAGGQFGRRIPGLHGERIRAVQKSHSGSRYQSRIRAFIVVSNSQHPLQVVSARHWKVAMPFVTALEWGSGKRPAATRLIVELTLANGTVGYGETICLLEFIEPVLVNTIFPIALAHRASDVERFSRHVLGAGYYHHKRAAVMAMACSRNGDVGRPWPLQRSASAWAMGWCLPAAGGGGGLFVWHRCKSVGAVGSTFHGPGVPVLQGQRSA